MHSTMPFSSRNVLVVTAIILATIVLTMFAMAAPAFANSDTNRIVSGRTFVETHCARCHAIDREDQSPMALAPPLRDLHKLYPIENLAEAFAEGIVTGHDGMPEFELDTDQIDALMAYLEGLK